MSDLYRAGPTLRSIAVIPTAQCLIQGMQGNGEGIVGHMALIRGSTTMSSLSRNGLSSAVTLFHPSCQGESRPQLTSPLSHDCTLDCILHY